MLGTRAKQIVDRVIAADAMSDGDLLALRRAIGADLVMDQAEADAIFRLNQVSNLPEGWVSYFTSVIAAYVDDANGGDAVVAEEHAVWLIEQIDRDGVVETETELALLLNVLKTATHVPDILSSYAMSQVYGAVVSGTGRVGQTMLQPGVIGEAEVHLLRRVLYAGSGSGSLRIDRNEAELILALNEATNGQDNHESWQRLYVQALANHLMLAEHRRSMDAQQAAALSAWVRNDTPRRHKRTALLASFKAWGHYNDHMRMMETQGVGGVLNDTANRDAERIEAHEAQWLVDRLLADGRKDDNERALLSFLRDECPDIHPSLIPLVEAA